MTNAETQFFTELPDQLRRVVIPVLNELQRARLKHAPMASAHEGWAVIYEEVDELWDEVRRRNPNRLKLAEEASQVAAMAMRFLLDVVGRGDA